MLDKQMKKIREMLELETAQRSAKIQIEGGTILTKPEGMSYDEAINALARQRDYEDQWVDQRFQIDAYPLDAAVALSTAIERKFGFADARERDTFFGKAAPCQVTVQVSHTESVTVPFGQVCIPGIDGALDVATGDKDGTPILHVRAEVRRKHIGIIEDLVDDARKIVRNESIYQGKALRFTSEGEPTFLNMAEGTAHAKDLVLTRDVEAQLEATVISVIENTEACKGLDIPLRRGVLLEGPYGTGKTLCAYRIAAACLANNWTFLYVRESSDFAEARSVASRFSPSVLFLEDLDRVKEVNAVQNLLDGIDTKDTDVMVVCTTNHIEALREKAPALLRPGRLDTILSVGFPDDEAALRLLMQYAGQMFDLANIEECPEGGAERIGKALGGLSPATLREVAERSKLWALKDGRARLHERDICATARQLREQAKLTAPVRPPYVRSDEIHFRARLWETMADQYATMGPAALAALWGGVLSETPLAGPASDGSEVYYQE